ERQGDGQVDLLVVENVRLELDGVLGLVGVFHQFALVDQQPGEQRDGNAVGVAGEVGEDQVQRVAVFERQAGGGGAAQGAVVDEHQQAIRVLSQLGNGCGEVFTE